MNSDRASRRREPIPIIVRRYAEESATRWWRRDSSYIQHPRTTFAEIIDFDETIDAYLDGLVEAGESGLEIAMASAVHDAPDVSADLFAVLAAATLAGEMQALTGVVEKTAQLPSQPRALKGLFAWCDGPLVAQLMDACLVHADVRYRDAALSQCHVQATTGGEHLARIINAGQGELLARAIRTAGECGRIDLTPAVRRWLRSDAEPNGTVRFWAAWSTVILGGRDAEAIETLRFVAESAMSDNAKALRLLCATMAWEDLIPFITRLLGTSENKLAVLAAGWTGHIGFVPHLIDRMGKPDLAHQAGEAFRLITGYDVELADELATTAEPSTDETVAWFQKHYSCPNAQAAANWWRTNSDAYQADVSYLLGEEITVEHLDDVLLGGEQAHRELALIRRAVLRPGRPLVPIHAHGSLQWLRMQQLKEEVK